MGTARSFCVDFRTAYIVVANAVVWLGEVDDTGVRGVYYHLEILFHAFALLIWTVVGRVILHGSLRVDEWLIGCIIGKLLGQFNWLT